MTKIQWTEATLNPLVGCSKASPGCLNCYAEKMARRLVAMGTYPPGIIYDGRWSGVVGWKPEQLEKPLRWRKPRMIFMCSMSDMFHESVPFEQIAAIWGVMAATPQHTYQVLTKRPERMREFFSWLHRAGHGQPAADLFPHDSPEWRIWHYLHVVCSRAGISLPPHHGGAWPLPNVWLGTTVEDQERANKRIPHLLRCPAVVRFVSCEPLLTALSIDEYLGGIHERQRADISIVGGYRVVFDRCGRQDMETHRPFGQQGGGAIDTQMEKDADTGRNKRAQAGGPHEGAVHLRAEKDVGTSPQACVDDAQQGIDFERYGHKPHRREPTKQPPFELGGGHQNGKRTSLDGRAPQSSTRRQVDGGASVGRSTPIRQQDDDAKGNRGDVRNHKPCSPKDRVSADVAVYSRGIDWLICGCESGPGRRPTDPDWIRALRDQCVNAGVPFFLKQMEVDGKLVKMPELDGRVWDQMPTVSS